LHEAEGRHDVVPSGRRPGEEVALVDLPDANPSGFEKGPDLGGLCRLVDSVRLISQARAELGEDPAGRATHLEEGGSLPPGKMLGYYIEEREPRHARQPRPLCLPVVRRGEVHARSDDSPARLSRVLPRRVTA